MPTSASIGVRNTLHSFLIYGAGETLARLVSFLGFLFLARTLSKGDYGLLESYVVTIGVIGVVGAAGLNNALQAFYYSKDEYAAISESHRISTAFYTLLIWQVGLIIPYMLFVALTDFTQSLETGLLLPCIALLTVQLQLMQDVFRLRFQPVKYLVSTGLSKGGTAIVAVSAVLMGGGINGYLWGYASALLVSFLMMIIFLRDDLTHSLHSSLAKSMLRYGLPFILVGIGSWAYSSLDRWLLASLSDLSAVGEYAFAVRVSFLVGFLSLAFGQAWAPLVFKLKESRPTDYRDIYADASLSFILVIAILAAAISIFTPEMEELMFRGKYKEALFAIFLLCFTAVLQSTTHFTAIGISLSRKTRYFAIFTWLVAFLSLLGNSALIPYWGINAAALMSFFSAALLSLLYFVVSQRKCRIRFVMRDVGWFALLISYLFIGSALLVLTSIPFVSISLKIAFLIPATIGSIIFLKRVMLRYVRKSKSDSDDRRYRTSW
jgi:O-antigen/teichoic acid export membrane protein